MTTASVEDLTAVHIPSQEPAPAAGLSVPETPPVSRAWRRGVGRAIGTGAELFAGTLSTGERVSVPLPAQLLSVVEVRMRYATESSVTGLESRPLAAAAVLAAVERFGLGTVEVTAKYRGDVLPEVGNASSSADVLAAVRAVADVADVEPLPSEVALLAAEVETLRAHRPAGLGHPGLVMVSDTGRVLSSWEWWPQYSMVILYPASDRRPLTSAAPQTVLDALASPSAEADAVCAAFQEGLEQRDALACAAAASRAAELRRSLGAHAGYDLYLEAKDILGKDAPLGVALSHTGSSVALLYPGSFPERMVTQKVAHLINTALSGRALTRISVSPAWEG